MKLWKCTTMPSINYKLSFFWVVLASALFYLLQTYFAYHLFYIEQDQLFLFTSAYFVEHVARPGSLAGWLAEFLVQFFVVPYVGPAIVALLLLAIAVLTADFLKHLVPSTRLYLLYILPAVALLFVHFDSNYRVEGTVAYLSMMVLLSLWVRIRSDKNRMFAACLFTPLLYLASGSVALLMVVIISLSLFLQRSAYWKWLFIPIVEVLVMGLLSVYFAYLGCHRWAFTPDLYYAPKQHPGHVVWLAWVALPIALLVARLLSRIVSRRAVAVTCVLQFVLLVFLVVQGIPRYAQMEYAYIKRLDYYARTAQWEKIIDYCSSKPTNDLLCCYLNLALQQRGELADRMFQFDQQDPLGLLMEWEKTESSSCLLSDIYYEVGAMAAARQMAFEGYVCALNGGNPRMLQRLIETNLIYGQYAVAEKYISLLEHTFAYRTWATEQRRFLYDDQAVMNDPELGWRRLSLPDGVHLAFMEGFVADLERFIPRLPFYSPPFQYLAMFYLLSKDMESFRELVERYYGTPQLPSLPIHFQEAMIFLNEDDPAVWEHYKLSATVIDRFQQYKKLALSQRSNPSAKSQLIHSFGDTVWFYYMFK